MNKKYLIGSVYSEYKPRFIDYGFRIYKVYREGNQMYLIKDGKITTIFLRETTISRLEKKGYVSLQRFQKRYNVDYIPIKKDKIKDKIKTKIRR